MHVDNCLFSSITVLILNFASKTNSIMISSKKKLKYSEEEFSRIVDDAAIILQRKSDHVMNIKQVAEYLGISEGAVRKRCQRKQLPYHRNASRLYFSRL